MRRNKYIMMVVLLLGIIILTGCPDGTGSNGVTPDDSPMSPAVTELQFSYKGLSSGGGYYTEVSIFNATATDIVVFWINDATDSADLNPGPYSFDPKSAAAGKLTAASFLVGYSLTSDYTEWAATKDSRTIYESNGDITTGSYDQIVSGSVLISKSGSTYTISWEFTTADGDIISGNYTGTPSIFID